MVPRWAFRRLMSELLWEKSQLTVYRKMKHWSLKQTHSQTSERKMKRQIWRWYKRSHETSGWSLQLSRFYVNYLLSWCDVGIDVFEDGLQIGIIAYAQVLDFDLTTLGPVLGHLRGVCRETNTGNSPQGRKILTVWEQRNRKQTPWPLLCCLAVINKSLKAIWITS